MTPSRDALSVRSDQAFGHSTLRSAHERQCCQEAYGAGALTGVAAGLTRDRQGDPQQEHRCADSNCDSNVSSY